MNTFRTILLILILLVLPGITLASGTHNHGSHAQAAQASEGHHGMAHDEHGGMAEDGTLQIGSQSSKGVNGEARIKDVKATMAKLGTTFTHHFMMVFTDAQTGQTIRTGQVALKITNPDAKVGEPIELTGMDGHFGADVILDMPGEYHFRLGTRLEDGTSRKYHFHYVNP